MSQPPPYDRQFNFQNQQSLTPADPLPADELDSELNAVKITLDAALANLNLIQRDDGALANDSVGVDQLKPELDGFAATAASAVAAKVAAEAAAVAAAASSSSASTSSMAANTARSDAQLAETNAELAQTAAEAAATASAASAANLIGTSTTSNDIGLGAKSFTTQAGKFFGVGTSLLITSDAAPATDYMHGRTVVYAGTALTVDVAVFGGSGTHTDWTIRVSGTVGAAGADGATGADGADGAAGAAGAPGIQFAFDASSTADSDPGPGNFRFNNVVPADATALYIDNSEFNGVNVTAWLDAFDDTGTSTDRGNLRVIDPESPDILYIFKVSGSVVDGTGYRKLTIAYVSGGGILNPGAPHSFAVFPKGATGAQGDPGPAGSGSGDVVGPGTTVDSEIVLFNGTTGTSIKRATQTGVLKAASGVIAAAVAGTDYIAPAAFSAYGLTLVDDANAGAAQSTLGISTFVKTILDDVDAATVRATIGAGTSSAVGDVTAAAAFATDERLVRSDGTGKGAQASTAALTDAGALSGLTTLSMSGAITIGTTAGTAPVIDPSGFGQLPEIAAPATPATGHVRFYAKADGHLYQKDDAGLETDLAAAGGGTSTEAQQCGQLSYVSATAIKFVPYNGDLIKINGALYSIPAAGIAGVANTSVFVNGTGASNLGASTLYYVYAFVNSGTVTADFSTTAHATSATAGNIGVEIKSGDNTRTLIGMIRTNASSQFADSVTQRFVRSWFNDQGYVAKNNYTAMRSTTSTTPVEVNSEIRIEILPWAGEITEIEISGGISNGVTVNAIISGIGIDSTTSPEAIGAWGNPSDIGSFFPSACVLYKQGLTEGYHYVTVLGYCTGGSVRMFHSSAMDSFYLQASAIKQ